MDKKKKGGSARQNTSSPKKPAATGGSKSRPSSSSSSGSKVSGGSKSRPVPAPSRSISSRVPAPAPATSQGKPKSSVSKGQSSAPAPAASTAFNTPQPASDMMASQLAAINSRWDRAVGMVTLASIFSTLESLSSEINGLHNDVSRIRARGYRFGRDWDERVAQVVERWPMQRDQAMRMAETQRYQLQNSARDVESLVRRAATNHSLINTAQNRINSLESSIRAAETSIQGTYGGVRNEVSDLRRQVSAAEALLDALDTASFNLLPDEHGIAYCRAQWVSDHQQPEGRLFLTDRRLVFEQYEERATKKVLFITTQKELVQEMLWESPVGAVDEMTTVDEKKFLGRREMLTLHFNERTRNLPSDAVLELKGGADNDTWRALIRRAKSGQIDGERFGAPSPQDRLAAEVEAEGVAAEAGKELPTRCPACNAPLPAVFKGMTQIVCDYCGMTINI